MMNKIKKLADLLLTASAGGDLSGGTGGEESDKPTPTPKTESTPTPPEETLDPETAEAVKYNVYVRMNNKIVDVLDTRYSYYKVVEMAPAFEELDGLIHVNEVLADCIDLYNSPVAS